MLYLIDCDGVLADFVAHVLRLTGSDVAPEQMKTYDIFEVVGEEHQDFLLSNPEFWRTLPVIPGAQEGVKAIRAEPDAEIVVVTSPWHSCKGWLEARCTWLKEHFGIEPADIISARRKELIRGDVLIDDRLKNVEAWQQAWPDGKAYIFDQPYNLDVEWPEDRRITWANSGVQ